MKELEDRERVKDYIFNLLQEELGEKFTYGRSGSLVTRLNNLVEIKQEQAEVKILNTLSELVETPHEINKHLISNGEVWDKALGVGANWFYRKVSDWIYELKRERKAT